MPHQQGVLKLADQGVGFLPAPLVLKREYPLVAIDIGFLKRPLYGRRSRFRSPDGLRPRRCQEQQKKRY